MHESVHLFYCMLDAIYSGALDSLVSHHSKWNCVEIVLLYDLARVAKFGTEPVDLLFQY